MTLDQALQDARQAFPNFPDEAFTLWLDDRIKTNGWPPAGLEWQGFLFGESPSYWRSLQWQKTAVSITANDVGPKSFSLAMEIIAAAGGAKNLIASYIPNTSSRFHSALAYVRQHATTPGTLLLLRTRNGLEVIDGCHRIAALLAAQACASEVADPSTVSAWLALPPALACASPS